MPIVPEPPIFGISLEQLNGLGQVGALAGVVPWAVLEEELPPSLKSRSSQVSGSSPPWG